MAMINGHFCTLRVGAVCLGEDGPPYSIGRYAQGALSVAQSIPEGLNSHF